MLSLPKILETTSDVFIRKFQTMTDGKEIDWLHERSIANVEIRTDRAYLIAMNHLQAAAITVISNAGAKFASPEEIGNLTNLAVDWVDATLKSLITTRVIQKHPAKDVYRINPNFKASKVKLNATVAFARPVKESSVDPQIEEERGLKTQAAIVRIMKARRVLDHQILLDEVMRQTSRFFAQNSERVCRQIEKLIHSPDKYIQRIDPKTYKYLTGNDQ